MQSKEAMKKLADNYETLVFVSKRYPSSMSRLKNLLMSEGVSETSARRKIADLETEAGYFCIGEHRLRNLINENKNADYLLWNGKRVQIKCVKFEKYVDTLEAI